MEKLDYWRLCDELSVVQAAMLLVGGDPSEASHVMNDPENERPENFSTAMVALSHAILGGRLSATIRREAWERGWDEEPAPDEKFTKNLDIFPDQNEFPEEAFGPKHRGIIYRATPDWSLTTVLVDDLQVWLKGRGFKTGFFFPQAADTPDFLDQCYKNYAPKLAAAIGAWQAVNADQDLIKEKTVKQALLKWLRKNADQFGLTKDDGSPNEQGIEEIAKISNWDTKGGAPKTPS
jgi:hypothetical protein